MKIFSKIIAVFMLASILITACKKDEALPTYNDATAPVLSATATNLLLVEADSATSRITFNWTNPKYSIADTSLTKYTFEIDSTGRGFAKSTKLAFVGTRNKSFTGKEINQLLLDMGLNYNVTYDIDVRVSSSQPNNNELKVSNILKLSARPYKASPKIPVPSALFIVGGATPGGWNNPVNTPMQELSQIDEFTFAAVLDLTPGSYLLLPVNGSWADKYGGVGASNNSNNPDGDLFKAGGSDLASPTTAGKYLITVDFFRGKFTCVPYTGPTLPTDLFIVGGATPGSWNNPVPVPSQQFTRKGNCLFEIASLNLNSANGMYLLLPVNGSWSDKYGGVGGSNGSNNPLEDMFKAGGSDLAAPTVAGDYKISINFATAKYKLTKL